jgi:hypothetical protein
MLVQLKKKDKIKNNKKSKYICKAIINAYFNVLMNEYLN